MRNNYEAPDVIELGEAQDVILGTKPEIMQFDATFGFGRQVFADADDIDEEES